MLHKESAETGQFTVLCWAGAPLKFHLRIQNIKLRGSRISSYYFNTFLVTVSISLVTGLLCVLTRSGQRPLRPLPPSVQARHIALRTAMTAIPFPKRRVLELFGFFPTITLPLTVTISQPAASYAYRTHAKSMRLCPAIPVT